MDHKSFVYFVLAPETNRVMIAATWGIHKRIVDLRAANACKLEVIGLFHEYQFSRRNHGPFTEVELHNKFAQYRLHGKWFTADPAILQFLEEHRDKNILYTRPKTVTLPRVV